MIEYYIGIDPGFEGMIAVLEYQVTSNDISLVDKYPIPIKKAAGKGNELDLEALKGVLTTIKSKYNPKVLILEKLNALSPGFSKGSSSKMLQGFGQLHAYIDCIGFDYELKRPVEWQREIMNSEDKEFETVKTKARRRKNRKTGGSFMVPAGTKQKLLTKPSTINAVKRLIPGVNLKKTERSKIDCHDLADAIGLAVYGIRLVNNTLGK